MVIVQDDKQETQGGEWPVSLVTAGASGGAGGAVLEVGSPRVCSAPPPLEVGCSVPPAAHGGCSAPDSLDSWWQPGSSPAPSQ